MYVFGWAHHILHPAPARPIRPFSPPSLLFSISPPPTSLLSPLEQAATHLPCPTLPTPEWIQLEYIDSPNGINAVENVLSVVHKEGVHKTMRCLRFSKLANRLAHPHFFRCNLFIRFMRINKLCLSLSRKVIQYSRNRIMNEVPY